MSEIAYDKLGPAKVLELHSAKTGITAIVVVDNTALGTSIGGVSRSTSSGQQGSDWPCVRRQQLPTPG